MTPRLDTAMRIAFRRRRGVCGCAVAGRWASTVLALVAGALVLDATSVLAWWVRLSVLVLVGAAAVIGVAMVLRALLRRRSEREASVLLDDMERAWGIDRGVLRSSHELGRGDEADGVARALIARASARAEAALTESEPRGPVDRFASSGRAWAVAAAALAVLGGFAAYDASALRITAQRLVDPTGDHPPVAPTRVTLVLESERVLMGDRASFVVLTEGAPVDETWLDVDGTRVGMVRGEGGVWLGETAALWSPALVRAHTATGYSRAVLVEPLALARVVETRVTVVPPEHARGVAPEREAAHGRGVACVEGSALRVELVCTIPVVGVRDESGAVVGEADGRRVVVERAAVSGRATFVPVTLAGDGAASVPFDVVVVEDAPPSVRFVGVLARVTAVEGEAVTLRATADDDVALAPPGVLLSRAGRAVEGVFTAHDAARGAITVVGGAAGGEFVVRASASDTMPGRAPAVAEVVVLVISREEANERRLEALTLSSLVDPARSAADAVAAAESGVPGAMERAAGALEELAAREGTDFEEWVGEDAASLAERLEREGASRSAALEAERTLRAPAERLALADALRRSAEALVRLTERQGVLAGRVATPGFDGRAEGAEQGELAGALDAIADELRTLGAQAASGSMDPDRLAALRGALREERARVLASCEALGEGDDERRLRDLALVELFFATGPLLDEEGDGAALMAESRAASVLLTRMLGLSERIGDTGLREELLVARELVRAIGREAAPALPVMGASALGLAGRIEGDGIGAVMRRAGGALLADEERGATLAGEAHALLLGLGEEGRASESEDEGAAGDAPLSLTPPSEDRAGGASASSSSGAGAAPSALDRLAQSRQRRRAEEQAASAGGEAAQEAEEGPEGGAASSTGAGSGGSGGTALGGQAVAGSPEAEGASPVVRPDGAGGVARWAEAETLSLTPGEAERLARVPERYRSLVAAYLRALGGAPAGGAGGRIGNE